MGVKIYISGISGNKEVKKRQQRVLMILDSKNIKYDVVDIAEPGKEDAKEFMQNNAKSFGATVGDANPRSPLPPQIFNDDEYCGDYDQFDMANEIDEIEKFLKLPYENDTIVTSQASLKLENGETKADDVPKHNEIETKEVTENEKPIEEDKVDNKENAEEITQNEVEDVTQNEVTEDEVKKPAEDDAAKANTENETKEENGIEEPKAVEA